MPATTHPAAEEKIALLSTRMNSIGLRKFFTGTNPQPIAANGSGDTRLTLWRNENGREGIETNGDPLLDYQDGFEAAKADLMD